MIMLLSPLYSCTSKILKKKKKKRYKVQARGGKK